MNIRNDIDVARSVSLKKHKDLNSWKEKMKLRIHSRTLRPILELGSYIIRGSPRHSLKSDLSRS